MKINRLPLLLFALLISACSVIPSDRETITLSENWKFRQVGTEIWYDANVPGYAQSDLIAQGLLPDPWFRTNEDSLRSLENEDWEYTTTFYVSAEQLENSHAELLFEGLDTYADVYLNDSLILQADNMFLAYEKNTKEVLQIGENNLRIDIHSPVKKGLEKLRKLPYLLQATSEQAAEDERTSIHSRKAPFHYGWDWGPRVIPSGIWRPVTLNFWSKSEITDSYFELKNLTESNADYELTVEIQSDAPQAADLTLSILGTDIVKTETIDLNKGLDSATMSFSIPDPELWWTHQLGNPHLYDINLSLIQGGDTLQQITQKLGVRTIELVQEKDVVGHSFYFKLNGRPVFMKGANYIPTDYFVANQTKEDYEVVIQNAIDVNMNMLRVWGGAIYENDAFYEVCDEKGILVWQDFMFACAVQPTDTLHLENIRKEAEYNVKRLRKHPSMAMWCGNNENLTAWIDWGWKDMYEPPISQELWRGYQDIFYGILDQAVSQHHPELSYHPSSPTTFDRKLGDVTSGDEHNWEIWFGDEPIENYSKHLPRFSSEYGMQSFPALESLEKFSSKETDWTYRSPVFEHRQRSKMEWFAPGMNGNEMIRRYIEKRYQFDGDFEDYVYLSQLNQAETLKSGAENHRRNMPVTMGSLFWQINDCWPALSWSTVDYYGQWKAAHHFIKKAYSDVLLSPMLEENSIRITVVSDLRDNIQGDLTVSSYTFTGKKLKEQKSSITIASNTSEEILKYSLSELGITNRKEQYTVVKFESDNGALRVQTELFLDLPKNLDIVSDPEIELDIQPIIGGYKVRVRSMDLVKNLRLNFPGISGRWSDNYFDLLPGKSKEVYFSIPEYTEGLEDKLELFHLGNTL